MQPVKKNQQHTQKQDKNYTWFGQYCLRPQSTQIYYYITLNELQIVDQQISLTQCISHSLEKIHTLCFAHSLRKILHLYFSCSLEGTLSLVFPLSLHSLEEALFFLQVVLFYLCWDDLQGMEAWLFIASRCPTSSFN
jgi:hypothetical protein